MRNKLKEGKWNKHALKIMMLYSFIRNNSFFFFIYYPLICMSTWGDRSFDSFTWYMIKQRDKL
jgi:hypothetical protein